MIVLDIESSGLDSGKNGIWQIGAIEFENPENQFIEEAKIDKEDEIKEEALKIIGKTEKELRDNKKQLQKDLIKKYLEWVGKIKEKTFSGQNVGWDISFIQNKCLRYNLMDKFREVHSQRSLDLHTIAQLKYKEIHGKYLLDEKGKSKMNLTATLEFCGLPDERVLLEGNKIAKEGKSHNALDDCKLEAECFSRLINGKNLLKEFKDFKVPANLRK